ncbi:MAG: sigma-70 family RNA polymerase sigma factor [Cyclobacteriaceae bacterium]
MRISHHYQIEVTSDEILMAKKDKLYFEKIYNTYFERIFRFLFRRTDNEADTADLASRTFVRALNGLPKYEDRGVPFSAWLYRIATNELYKFYRKKNSHQILSLEEESVKEVLEDDSDEADEIKLSQLKALMGQLKDEELNILELRFFEGLEFQEIAFVLQKKESAVKMRVYRLLEKLKIRFNESAPK